MLLRNLQGGHFYWDTVYTVQESYGGWYNLLCVGLTRYMTSAMALVICNMVASWYIR